MKHERCPMAWASKNGGKGVWNYNLVSLTCRLCDFSCQSRNIFRARRHTNSSGHIKRLEVFKKHKIRGEKEDVSVASFHLNLTKLLIACDIPIKVLDHPIFINFIQKYTGRLTPSRSGADNLVTVLSNGIIEKMKNKLKNRDIFITMDETTNHHGRPLLGVLMGALDGTTLEKPYLVNLIDVEASDANTLKSIVSSSITGIMGEDFKPKRFKVFITANKSSYSEAGEQLKVLHPGLIHVTCVAQGLKTVAEMITLKFPFTKELVSKVKKLCLQAGKPLFNTTAPSVAPLPHVKESWLNAVDYVHEHFDNIKTYINTQLDGETNSSSTRKLKTAINNNTIHREINFIRESQLPKALAELETERLPLATSMGILDNVIVNMNEEPFKNKLEEVLETNPGYSALREILRSNCDETVVYRTTPIVNTDAERLFKMINSMDPLRKNTLSTKKMKEQMIIKWNTSIDVS